MESQDKSKINISLTEKLVKENFSEDLNNHYKFIKLDLMNFSNDNKMINNALNSSYDKTKAEVNEVNSLNKDNLNTNEIESYIFKARILSLISHIILALSDIPLKSYTEKYETKGLFVLNFWRSFFCVVTCYIFMIKEGIQINPLFEFGDNNNKRLHLILRSISPCLANIFLTFALSKLKLGIVIVVISTYPIFQAILGQIFLNEKISKSYYVGLFISLFGVYLMSLGHNDQDDNKNDKIDNSWNIIMGYIYCTLNTLLIGQYLFSSKVLLDYKYEPYNLNLHSFVWSLPVVFFLNLFDQSSLYYWLDPYIFIFGLLNGVFVFIGFILLSMSIQYVDQSKSSYLTYIEIPISALIGYFIYGEILSYIELLGGLIIIVTMVGLSA